MAVIAIMPNTADLNTYAGQYVCVRAQADGTVRTDLCIAEGDGNARAIARMEVYSVCGAITLAMDLGIPVEICEG
jgi:hypothetical protein